MFKRKKKITISPELDTKFYSHYYTDLTGKSDESLHRHWQQFGKSELRSPNLNQFLKQQGIVGDIDTDFEIDHEFYRRSYPDVSQAGVSNNIQAKIHWLLHGQKEGRARTLVEWLKMHGGYSALPIEEIDIDAVITRHKQLGQEITITTLQKTLGGDFGPLIHFADNAIGNAAWYERLGKSFYLSHKGNGQDKDRQAARSAYQASLHFYPTARVLELLGNTYLDEGDWRTAAHIYADTVEWHADKASRWLFLLLAQALRANHRPVDALQALVKGLIHCPEFTHQHEQLEQYANDYYLSMAGKLKLLAIQNKREALQHETWQYTETLYQAYFAACGVTQATEPKAGLNTDRILIIGDYHVAQCVRYRIEQKVEQLESQGKTVTCIDWTKLAEHGNDIALHDLVIFYRVPAVPTVIKSIAQVNAAGKLSFYEIDDLLFDTSYPAELDTYGGYLSLDTHIELRKGMAQFYAAARLCRYGIASTRPLCEQLQTLVTSGTCLLHRNGLDKHNQIKIAEHARQDRFNLFYGSGTQAHNSDFIELVLPALTCILETYPQAQLIIAGYLKLPTEFTTRFSGQFRQVPPVKSIKAYWSLLQQADINLAVLHDDLINGCKSELKWFEAACFGIPSVVSSTENYRDVLTNGEDAFLAGNEQEWITYLSQLIEDSALRKQMAANALNKIERDYSVNALGQSLAAQLDSLVIPRRKRKIALVNVFFPPQAIGGATRVVADNVDVLQAQYGDDIELVVFTSEERCTVPYQLVTYQYNGITVYRSTIFYRENMDWHPQDPEMYCLFEQFLALEQPDLVHFHCVQRLTGSVVEATRDAGIPYMVTVHDAWWISDHQFLVDAHGRLYPDGHPDRYAPRTLPNNVTLGQSIERIDYLTGLLHWAKEVLTVSDAFAEIYRKNGITQIGVNRNGISANQPWAPKETGDNPRVVCGHIGGMSAHKGYFLLKEAIEQLQPRHIALLLVDHSKEEGYIEQTNWGAVPVTLIGRVAQDHIVDLYRQIDVLFAPSIWPESYGLVTREAAACGCWIVASNLGGIGEDVRPGENGWVIDPTLRAVAKTLTEIDAQAVRYKEHAKSPAPRLAQKQVAELMEFYKE